MLKPLSGSPPLRLAPGSLPETESDPLLDYFIRGEAEAHATPDHLAYLDRGINESPYRADVPSYPSRLEAPLPAPPFPKVGQMPAIDTQGLNFLDSTITEACVCVGDVGNGTASGTWLGRKPLDNVQMWSASKMIPMLRLVSKTPGIDIGGCILHDPTGASADSTVPDADTDIVTYRKGVERSNAMARALKQFDTPAGLEKWVRTITHNTSPDMEFQGGYGAAPYIMRPELVDGKTGQVLLHASGEDHTGNNLISAYDLCRFVSMLGWHNHLPPTARLPEAGWKSLQTVVEAMGQDTCRYVDVAIDALGLKDQIAEPVIISKLGFGFSDTRHRTEAVYVAFVQFKRKPIMAPRTLAIALRGAENPLPDSAESMDLDAHMANAVAQILQRFA